MKRLPAIFAALLLLTSCRESPTMPDNRPASQEHPPTASDAVPTNEELLAYAEEHLAAYRYHDAAAWAYELKRRGIILPTRLQQVLDEERYDPDAPCPPAVSTISGRSKSACCGRKRKTATRPPPSGCGNITASLRNKRPRINGRPIIGMPKPAEAVSRSRFGGNAGRWRRRIGRVVGRHGCGVLASQRIAGRRFPLPLRLNQERPSESFRRPLILPVRLSRLLRAGDFVE